MATVTLNINVERAKKDLSRSLGAGLRAGAIFLNNRIKEVLSIPAPRKRVTSRRGITYYRATTPATPGAPPRKLSGRLRASMTYEVETRGLFDVVARVGTNVIYSKRHEHGNHKFMMVTLNAVKGDLGKIIGTSAVGGTLGGK